MERNLLIDSKTGDGGFLDFNGLEGTHQTSINVLTLTFEIKPFQLITN